MPADQLVQFTNLKGKICQAAAEALDVINPQYVQTFQKRMETGDDIRRVIDETRPLLGDGFERWNDLLTAVLDLTFAIDKVERSLTYVRLDMAVTPEENGAWFICHKDLWTFYVDALFEKLDTLVTKTIRYLVRPKEREGWQAIEDTLRKDVRMMKNEIGKLRDPLAHGLGNGRQVKAQGGSITGVQEERLWESVLASGVSDVEVVTGTYHQVLPHRDEWYSRLEKATNLAFERVGKTSEDLIHHLN